MGAVGHTAEYAAGRPVRDRASGPVVQPSQGSASIAPMAGPPPILSSPPAPFRPAPGPALRSRSADVAAFVAGGLAAALGIAIGELIAGLVSGAPSLVIAIGDLVIALQPAGAKDVFVELFGQADKLVLNVLIVVSAVLIAGLLGVAGRRRWAVPVIGFAVAGRGRPHGRPAPAAHRSRSWPW